MLQRVRVCLTMWPWFFGLLWSVKWFKRFRVSNCEELVYYDAMNISEMVLLKYDLGTSRLKNIALMIGNMHLYFIHTLSQHEIIEKLSFSLEYNVVGSNDQEEEYVVESNVVALDEGVISEGMSWMKKRLKNRSWRNELLHWMMKILKKKTLMKPLMREGPLI